MSIWFEQKLHPQHLELVCSGPYSLAGVCRLYEQAFRLASEGGREAVLIDGRKITLSREPTLTERYDMAVYVADLQSKQKPRIRLAILGYEPLLHPERFGEIVAANRGALARAFTEENIALEWLLPKLKAP